MEYALRITSCEDRDYFEYIPVRGDSEDYFFDSDKAYQDFMSMLALEDYSREFLNVPIAVWFEIFLNNVFNDSERLQLYDCLKVVDYKKFDDLACEFSKKCSHRLDIIWSFEEWTNEHPEYASVYLEEK